ncbi:MAG: hypothetical protein GZ087_11935 [Flavobacterium sp.]|nr:hypothetical protein [Flavobacterium sp.]
MTKEDIIISTIIGIGTCAIYDQTKIACSKSKIIIKLKQIKFIKYLRYILIYVLPIISITIMMFNKKTQLNFSNISVFLILSLSFIYNILMSHIITIYKMIGELANTSSEKLNQIDYAFGKVKNHLEIIKKENNLN